MKNYIWLITLLIFAPVVAQDNGSADSLRKAIEKSEDNSAKVEMILKLGKNYLNDDPDLSIQYAKQARDIAEKIEFKEGTALALKDIGLGYYLQGKYLETLDYWERSLLAFSTKSKIRLMGFHYRSSICKRQAASP